jgi:hypothetical protein
VSIPFQGRPGAQKSYAALARRPGRDGDPVAEALAGHDDRLDRQDAAIGDLGRRVSRLETAAGDGQDGRADAAGPGEEGSNGE